MQIPAGSVIDPYDDDFESLKAMFANQSAPDFIKTASIMDDAVLAALPDHAFAVVLLGDGAPLRKYACVDKAHTAVNTLYFIEKGAALLPEEAKHVAAENLLRACVHFQITPPAPLAKEAKAKKVLIKSDGPILTTPAKKKESELVGTSVMPVSAPAQTGKLASVMGDPYVTFKLAEEDFFTKLAYDPGAHVLDPEAKLSSYDHVASAARHFTETGRELHPRARHEACVKIASQAATLGVTVSDTIQKYGSRTYADDEELATSVETRRQVWADLENGEAPDMLKLLMEKRASMSPDVFAETLAELDIVTGIDRYWDSGIPDPWFTTFGKVAQESWRWVQGTEALSEGELRTFASEGQDVLKDKFGEDLARALARDPIPIFESLPLNSKRAIARMAQQHASGL